jgi:ADP-ribose pyrophosphatase YjhB (NUDIX family)
MLKIFFENRLLAISSDYEECSKLRNSIVFTLQTLNDVPPIINEFIENEQLINLYIYSGDISDDRVFEEICKKFKKITAAGGLVKNSRDEILMIYRFNHWDLPKGWHEDNEIIEQTAIREVEEECGLNELELIAPIIKTHHIYKQNQTWIFKETHWFELYYKKNEQPKPQQEEGIEEVKWVSVDGLPEYLDKTYPSVKEVFKASKIL